MTPWFTWNFSNFRTGMGVGNETLENVILQEEMLDGRTWGGED